ncbi:uncharacterized protein LOC122509788 [Leptopilina heterotoma]|uniref:uncharacterized protein LOC122509788 n=1 Tax=Leptopilina heterotoma TaxID=63436 RepID=UPI001CA8F88C|nr:uncharacterized protein LOC122509788 [Leptopilina heterotoma]
MNSCFKSCPKYTCAFTWDPMWILTWDLGFYTGFCIRTHGFSVGTKNEETLKKTRARRCKKLSSNDKNEGEYSFKKTFIPLASRETNKVPNDEQQERNSSSSLSKNCQPVLNSNASTATESSSTETHSETLTAGQLQNQKPSTSAESPSTGTVSGNSAPGEALNETTGSSMEKKRNHKTAFENQEEDFGNHLGLEKRGETY